MTKAAGLFIVFLGMSISAWAGIHLNEMKGRVPVRRGIFLVSLVVCLLLTAAGILLGDPARVFANAVIVCLSCIGIQ
ncbi:MAG: hypothetical protein AB1563_07765 [Bacillota bacterium]|nr:hypothetical protein [Bacillota bacterium]MDI6638594.1 hypothetical protein [Bacillota bacterium]